MLAGSLRALRVGGRLPQPLDGSVKTVEQKLADFLEVEGWNIERRHETALDWWADEIWELRSRWSPEGARAFITFLVDPQFEGDRSKGQAVWGIGSSSMFPQSREEAESHGIISVGSRRFKAEIEDFLSRLDELRLRK